MTDEILYAVRSLNVLLGLGGATWLGVRSAVRHSQYPPIMWLFILTLIMYALTISAAQIISITYAETEIPTGAHLARALLLLMSNLTLLITLTLTQPRREYTIGHYQERP